MTVALMAIPASAREVEDGGTIFDDEQGLDLSGLLDSGGELVMFAGDDPTGERIFVIPVSDASALDLTAVDLGGTYGTYFALFANGTLSGCRISVMEIEGTDTLATVAADPIDSPTLALTSNKASVGKRHAFAVTITGNPGADYYLYLRDAGVPADRYPFIKVGQPSVNTTPEAQNEIKNIAGDGFADVASTGAIVTTNRSGIRTVEICTNGTTDARTFTIVAADPADPSRSAEVAVSVEEGEVTITAEGAGVYYLGEEVRISGTNTASDTTYLFVTGLNLGDQNGVKLDNISAYAANGQYVECDVKYDDTWEYRWDTAALAATPPDPGFHTTYTVYAASASTDDSGFNVDKSHLSGVRYSTFSTVLKEPVLVLDPITSEIAGGDDLRVTGYAEGDPDKVAIWILGPENPVLGVVTPVGDDGSFEYVLDGAETVGLMDGQYFVVIQHPMYDRLFNVCPAPGEGKPYQIRDATGNLIDLGTLLPSEAVASLLSAIDGSGSDDIHAETSFMVDEDGITVGAEGTGTFFLGEEVFLSGINTGNDRVYLFLAGGSLGDGVALDNVSAAAPSGNYVVREAAADGTWEYRWDTAALRGTLPAGTYTIYAAATDRDLGGCYVDRNHLEGVRNATTTLTFQQPYVSSSFNRTFLLTGEALTVSGTAAGRPESVCVWILGDGCRIPGVSVPVRDDGTYAYVLGAGHTAALSGEVWVIVQHPMMDGVFNVCPAPEEGKPYQIRDATGNLIDLGSLTTTEAVNALDNGI
ncbi:MAG: hypothetical protein PHP59_08570, partial [Methanofollis sp.]|nr:hypothetical protein [Methanofollis sp.]